MASTTRKWLAGCGVGCGGLVLVLIVIGVIGYTYLYVVAYGDSLRSLPPDAALFGQEGVGLRAREVLRTMLRNQLAALATAGSDAEPADGWRREQQAEIDRLEAEPDRLPWQDGLPPALAASLAPYRGRLGAAFCAATAGLELTRSRKRGLSITSD